jgi:peptide deformylase
MSILPILTYPDPRLRIVSDQVEDFGEDLSILAQDMRDTMLAAPGAGLAAPQVGRRLRLIVCDWSDESEGYGKKVVTLVNPAVVKKEGKMVFEEGCLSVSDLTAEVERAERIEVRAQDVTGSPFTIIGEGRRAVILQHEIDHLDGILFIDHLSRLKREIYHRKLKKAQKLGEGNSRGGAQGRGDLQFRPEDQERDEE